MRYLLKTIAAVVGVVGMMVGLALMISTIPDKGSKVVTKEGLQEHISKRGHPECVMEKVREHFDKADQDLLLEKNIA